MNGEDRPGGTPSPEDEPDQYGPGTSAFGAAWWEEHYRAGPAHEDGSPSPVLAAETANLPVGAALDAGCGTGADAIWLASRGWQVTAIDISPTAVEQARERAARSAAQRAGRIEWATADLTTWTPPRRFDLVVSQYVHPDVPFDQFARLLADAVAPGGTLLVVGHDHADQHSAQHAPRAAALDVRAVTAVLDPAGWQVDVADVRERRVMRGPDEIAMHDIVVRAHRVPLGR